MLFDPDDPTYQALLGRVIQSDARVVPFVGAGLSLYGLPDDRLPHWGQLIRRIVVEGRRLGLISPTDEELIEDHLANDRPIDAADRVLDLVGEPTFKRLVQAELDDSEKPIPPGVTQLVAIGWSLIVTTNLDRFIRRAYLDRHGAPINAVPGIDTHRLASVMAGIDGGTETSLAQIHGDLDFYPSWALTGNQYQELLLDPGYNEALKHLFLRQVFFVGFGLQDRDFDVLLETIAQIYPAGAGEFFALLGERHRDDQRVLDLIRSNGLRPIFYPVEPPDPSDPYGGHRAVHECLEHLAKAWASATLSLPFTLKYFSELDPNFVGRSDHIERLEDELLGRRAAAVQVVGLGGIGKTSLVQQFLELKRLEIAEAGFERIFGCSFYRAEVGEFVQDLELACVGPSNLSLPGKVQRICEHVRSHRLLLTLDGLENVLNENHQLDNPYLLELIDSVRRGEGAVLTTSRVAVNRANHLGPVVELEPLSRTQSEAFLNGWGLTNLPPSALSRLADATAGHPLALRVLAGVLRDRPTSEAIAAIDAGVVLEAHDELDPLKANQLARVLASYHDLLSETELAFMTSWAIIDRAESYPMVEAVLSRDYVGPCINETLTGRDLRPVITSLLEKRLLSSSKAGELTCHPTVREYFRRRAEGLGSTTPLHRELATHYLEGSVDEPASFEAVIPLVSAARHAALSQDWSLFDDLFRRRLMRGHLGHLCNTLGAWDEALATARLALPPNGSPEIDLVFYQATVARCLKHVGRSDESVAAYEACLRTAIDERHTETAKCFNNLLTLFVWRGELSKASQLVAPNFGALSWIGEEWIRRWQTEHGLSSVAYLRLLRGDLIEATELFDRSTKAWAGFDGDRLEAFDHYPIHRAELRMLHGEDNQSIVSDLDDFVDTAAAHGWPEAECRARLQLVDVHLQQASEQTTPFGALAHAERHLGVASNLQDGLSVDDVAVQLRLVRFKYLLLADRTTSTALVAEAELLALLDSTDRFVDGSSLALSAPEVIAGRGHLAFERGDIPAAQALLGEALEVCRSQGNWLYANSPRYITGGLRRLLDGLAHDPPNRYLPAIAVPDTVTPPVDPDDLKKALDEVFL